MNKSLYLSIWCLWVFVGVIAIDNLSYPLQLLYGLAFGYFSTELFFAFRHPITIIYKARKDEHRTK